MLKYSQILLVSIGLWVDIELDKFPRIASPVDAKTLMGNKTDSLFNANRRLYQNITHSFFFFSFHNSILIILIWQSIGTAAVS